MERHVFDQMAELDQRHWWYRARRQVLSSLIGRMQLPPNAKLLEIGCGTGHNLQMLGGFGHVDALELDDEARDLAEKRLGRKIMQAPLPELNEVKNRHYDLIGAFDVIEHIADDTAAIASIATKLKPNGKFVMTVPAHQWMWSAHDVVNHHQRRYSKRGLRRLIEESPLRLERVGYFNSFLFPAALAERMAAKLRGKESGDLDLPAAPLNAALRGVFAAERHFVGRIPLPMGLSLFAIGSMEPVKH